jgi:hypothetical protein
MPWQTPQMVLDQNSANDGAMWWVKRRENTAPQMHSAARRTFAPNTPEISSERSPGSLRWREVSREAEMSNPYSTKIAITAPIAWAKTTLPQPDGPRTRAKYGKVINGRA